MIGYSSLKLTCYSVFSQIFKPKEKSKSCHLGDGQLVLSRGLSLLIKLNVVFIISVIIYNILLFFIAHKPFVWAFEETAHIGMITIANGYFLYHTKRRLDSVLLSR